MSDIVEVDFSKLVSRPCIVVSTLSSNGVSNAAPFSFNSPATTKPPMYGFCCEVEHDTLRNIRLSGEFVVNLVGEEFGPLMRVLALNLPYGVSEIAEAGLTEFPSKVVEPPRIAEAYGWLECREVEIVELSPRAVWVFGEILVSETRSEVIDGVVDVENVKSLQHIWGEDYVVGGTRKQYPR